MSEGNDTSGLSDGARRLAEEVGLKGELAPYLKEHPELLEAVDEYLTWRDASHRAICNQAETPGTAHSLKQVIQNIGK